MKFAASLALTLLIASTAQAMPFGPTADVGVVLTPTMNERDFSLRSMVGPVVQVGFQLGDWWNSEFMFQFTHVSGNVDFAGDPTLHARDSVQTVMGGYQLTLDIFGKKGMSGFTPFVGAGVLVGLAQVKVSASSDDPAVQAQILASGAQAKDHKGAILELHGTVGLRYRLLRALGIRAELGVSTYGGFFGTLQPKVGVDYVF